MSIHWSRREWLTTTSLGVLALSGRRAHAQSKQVILGISVPITGDEAQYGLDIRQGAELAIEQSNQQNVVPGLTFVGVVEDSRSDPKEAANVAQKFAARGDVLAVVGDFSSTPCLAAAPIYQRNGIIMMTPTASHPDITKTGDYIFRDTPIAAGEVGAVTDWAAELGAKRVGVIGRNDDYGRAYAEIFRANSVKFGANVLSVDFINPGEQDFKPLITGLRARTPDTVMLALFQVEAALLFQQARDMNFHPTFMSGAGLFNPQLLELAGQAANGLLLVSAYFPGSSNPQVRAFVPAFQAKYGKVPSKFSAQAYDAARLIIDAIRRSGTTDRVKVRAALAETKNFHGVVGDITIGPDREIKLVLSRLKVADAKFVEWTKG
jgi:branched-chain amino acid transport system substrate-binding protein